MRRWMIVAALLLCLPMVGEGQSIRYYPAGGLSELTSSGTAITSTLPLTLPDGSTAAPSLNFAGSPTTGFYYGSSQLVAQGASLTVFTASTSYGILAFGNPSTKANGFIDTDTLGLRTGNATAKGIEFVNGAIRSSKSKVLTDNTATAFVRLTVADDDYEGCGVIYTAYAEDTATDARQTRTGRVAVAILNNSGTETAVFSTGDSAVAVTAGTFTCTFDGNSAAADTIDLRATCDTSLAATTTLTFEYRLDCPSTLTVTPQ